MSDARFPASADRLLQEIWRRLAAGAAAREHPFRTPGLATAGPGGADVRTVVLRRVDPGARRICCHTDLRSPKVAALAEDPVCGWLFYDAGDRVQLRVRGIATLHSGDALADRQWAATSAGSRRCYLSAGGPGATLEEPGAGLPEALLDRPPTAEESEPGRAHFVVLACEVRSLDWLALDSRGHRRARLDWDGGAWRHAWTTP